MIFLLASIVTFRPFDLNTLQTSFLVFSLSFGVASEIGPLCILIVFQRSLKAGPFCKKRSCCPVT